MGVDHGLSRTDLVPEGVLLCTCMCVDPHQPTLYGLKFNSILLAVFRISFILMCMDLPGPGPFKWSGDNHGEIVSRTAIPVPFPCRDIYISVCTYAHVDGLGKPPGQFKPTTSTIHKCLQRRTTYANLPKVFCLASPLNPGKLVPRY